MYVKICGVRTPEDLDVCHAAGADAVGFNFCPTSPRYLDFAAAERLSQHVEKLGPEASGGKLERWGIFLDASVEEIDEAFARKIIDVAQLHGHEPPEFGAELHGPWVKAVRVTSESDVATLDAYPCRIFVVDGPGGGKPVPVEWAKEAVKHHRILLAGGLTPENVAVAIKDVRPFGVDVASGVERAPGEKDPEKIRRFIAAANAAAKARTT